jgi:hypothetical protein
VKSGLHFNILSSVEVIQAKFLNINRYQVK